MLLSLCDPLLAQTSAFFSLSLPLLPHSYSLLVLTFIKLTRPPGGGGRRQCRCTTSDALLVIVFASSSFLRLTEHTQVSVYPVVTVSGNSLYGTHGS